MEEINTRNPKPFEIVGSRDLRESFDDVDRIRGSFFINGIELHQFEANSPASVVAQINARSSGHFVHAEIDDGGHLVLMDKSGAPISIRKGAAYVDPAPTTAHNAAVEAVQALKKASQEEQSDKPENNVLHLLGLDETAKESEERAPRAGFEVGRSAEERRKAHGFSEDGDRKDQRGAPTAGAQVPSNPTPGGSDASGGKLADGRGRTGEDSHAA